MAGTCRKREIAERLMMALAPSDFPDEVAEIEEHLKDCPACREEMKTLRQVEKFLEDNKDLVAEFLSPCPDVDALSSFAHGETSNLSLERHIELCDTCREQIALIRELSENELESDHQTASPREKAFFREALDREYGSAAAQRTRPAQSLWETIRDWFHVPSLALGAAVAALLMAFLMPRAPEEFRLTAVLSSVAWEKQLRATKGLLEPKQLLPVRKKVALVLLLHSPSQPLVQDAEHIYGKLKIVKKLGTAYDFLSPGEIKDALSGREISGNLMKIADAIFEKTNADYILAFEILPAKTGDAVKGTLFQRNRLTDLGSISQTGLTLSRMPSRITTMTAELLLEAEHS